MRLSLGQRIRERRKELGLTMAQVADVTGLTVSFISQVETGKTGTSIDSLRLFSEALDTPIFQFLLGVDDSVGIVTRRSGRRTLDLPDSHLKYELLLPNLNHSFELWMGHLEPGSQSSGVLKGHRGEECLLVLQGVMQIELPDEKHLLSQGDTIIYDGRVPHKASNVGEEELVFLSVVAPAMF
jgi:transcriptional regulator with XRE-family HTH domain